MSSRFKLSVLASKPLMIFRDFFQVIHRFSTWSPGLAGVLLIRSDMEDDAVSRDGTRANMDAGAVVMRVNGHPGCWGDDDAPGIGETIGPYSGNSCGSGGGSCFHGPSVAMLVACCRPSFFVLREWW